MGEVCDSDLELLDHLFVEPLFELVVLWQTKPALLECFRYHQPRRELGPIDKRMKLSW